MSKSRLLVVAMISSLVAMPTIATAQSTDAPKENPQDFVHDVLKAMLGPNWNVFLHSGVTTNERFLLQEALNPINGERALKSNAGFDIGLGAGVDFLLRTGLRASYTFTTSDLNFRTDNGNGSNALNIDNVGTLKSSTLALEIMHYMLPSRSSISPYGTLGIQGTWWSLDEKSPFVTSAGASTPFSISPLFSFGVQVKASDQWSGRLEATLAGGHNPFTGNKSFRAAGGAPIDEPIGINRTDFRLAGVYYFKSSKDQANTVARK